MLIFRGDKLLVQKDVYEFEKEPEHTLNSSQTLPPVWREQEIPLWCEVEDSWTLEDGEWLDLRAVWQRYGEEAFLRAGTAWQYMNWLKHARFCSVCGAPLKPKQEDRGMTCVKCGYTSYAPLHPAIIVAVERDGKLLLAHNTRMPAGRYSVIAGFVEPGETLEQTVRREIREEVSIEVEDIRYFGSQPWPFPCSLMLGFTARWKSGELSPDGTEINDAGWYLPNALPDIPAPVSISRRLIDDFVRRKKEKKESAQDRVISEGNARGL
ncbi:MAG: NAD(+) diphosphatase [Synergistaceae bacterium]|jgi:NAD+ diphosphatase|nr:NAD(+) diphosphatase [Synergistaceae bacterium]